MLVPAIGETMRLETSGNCHVCGRFRGSPKKPMNHARCRKLIEKEREKVRTELNRPLSDQELTFLVMARTNGAYVEGKA